MWKDKSNWTNEQWQQWANEDYDRNYGREFFNSDNPKERVLFVKWAKMCGKHAKDRGDKKIMMVAYKMLKDYEIYPQKMVNTEEYWNQGSLV